MKIITLKDYNIPKTMNAIVLKKQGELVFKKIPVWQIIKFKNNEDLMLIEVKACGICGSAFRYFNGENPWSQHTLGYHVKNKHNIVLGHEFAGIVVSVANKKNIKWLGKRVAPICSRICGKCYYCKTGRKNICPNTVHIGHGQGWQYLSYYPGAYAQYVVSWGEYCYEIPDNVDFTEASMMDIIAVCLHVFKKGYNGNNLPILIIGCGPAGNCIAQIAKLYNIKKIILIEKSDTAIKIAKNTGFKYILNPLNYSPEKLKKEILKITGNHGCISVYDSIGNNFSFDLGFNVLDKCGIYVNMAVHDQLINLNSMKLSGERKITTSSNFDFNDYKEGLNLLKEKKLKLKPWFTKIKLSTVPEVFNKTISNNKNIFKIIINDFNN